MVEPRGTGMALFTLRAAEEVRPAQFGATEGEVDAEMVAIAGPIIRQRTGHFDPRTYRDRYQDSLPELIEAKMKGLPIKPKPVSAPPPVIDLMATLKRSLAQEISGKTAGSRTASTRKGTRADRRQAALLLPLSGRRERAQQSVPKPTSNAPRRRKIA